MKPMMPMLNTEQPHPEHHRLDEYPVQELVDALIDDQARAAAAVRAAAAAIARAVEAAVPRLEAGGRLIYVGAGTSGRLGLLDSVELNPTFSWPHERSIAQLAGGAAAIHAAVVGAEDDFDQGGRDLAALLPGPQDVVLLRAAPGATPTPRGAPPAAKGSGALALGFANNPGSPLAAGSDVGILLDTGPEVISGSTRLKAGTAQKIALNTFSSAVMVRLHKVFGNLIVDVRPTNAKLVRRAVRLVALAAGADQDRARDAFEACGREVKPAIVSLLKGIGPAAARQRLAATGGNVRAALGDLA